MKKKLIIEGNWAKTCGSYTISQLERCLRSSRTGV
jgi:hypothetical protein